jgi:hypothetical protein
LVCADHQPDVLVKHVETLDGNARRRHRDQIQRDVARPIVDRDLGPDHLNVPVRDLRLPFIAVDPKDLGPSFV